MSDTTAQTSNAPRPFCLGRYLIDLPPGVEAFLPSASTDYLFGTIQTERVQMTAKQFVEKMEKREQEFKKGLDKEKYILNGVKGAEPDNWRIFVITRQLLIGPSQGVEAYKFDKGVLFYLRQTGFVNLESTLTELQTRLLPSLRARAPDEIPTEPGLCIADGFIASDGAEKARERVFVSLESKRWPDVYMSVDTSTVHKTEPFLLERMSKAEVPAEIAGLISQMKRIREGRHDVGPIKAEESLVLLPAEHGVKNTDLHWESYFALNDPFTPSITVQLKTDWEDGASKPIPTISEKDAVQLFDAIVNSIRLRPTSGPAKRSEAPAPQTPLGELAATGRICPETGWWHCADEGAPIVGGSRLYIRQGERMPDVVLQGEPNLWQKVKGETPRFRRATIWTLTAYPDAPKEGLLGDTPPEVSTGDATAVEPGKAPSSAALPDLAPPTDKA